MSKAIMDAVAGPDQNQPCQNQQRLRIESPVGWLDLLSEAGLLVAVRFSSPGDSRAPGSRAASASCPVLRQAERELCEFFDGKRQQFTIPLTIRGTPFQNRVWNALCDVPFGATCSYSELARRIGSPKGVRAVGVALGRNPIAIVVPCHRVIGADGSLVGFGGGLEIKRLLLEHESRFP